jgi:protein SCO1/2
MLARVKGPLRYAVIAVLFVAAGIGAYLLGSYLRPRPAPAGTELQNPVPIQGLTLVDQSGGDFRLSEDLRGDVALVFFGYTRCPDVCPLTMSQLSSAYAAVGEPQDLHVVMVSVDPEHDTPEVIGSYVERFHPSFIGLTGANSQVAEAAKAFFVGYGGAGVDLVHTEYVAVLDRQGRLRYVYGSTAVPSLAQDIPRLLREL